MNLTPDERRIRAALEQIETPMYDIGAAVQEQRSRLSHRIPIHSPHRILAAVLAALLLMVTAAAAVLQFSGGWHTIFGNGVTIPEGITLPLQSSQTVDGYTITLEDAIVSDSSIAVIFSVKSSDGAAIPGPVDFGNIMLSVDGSEPQTPEAAQSVFNPDAPSVQYCYQEYEYAGTADTVSLTFTAGPIICMESSDPVTADIDLDALYQAQPLAFPAGTEGEARTEAYSLQYFPGVSLPLAGRAPEITFAGIAFDENGLCLALSYPVDGASAEFASITDMRTGESISALSSSTYGNSSSRRFLHQACFPDICADDLPYLKPQLTYTFPIVLANQTMTFSFRTSTADSWSRELALQLADGTTITHLIVSPTCIELEGMHPDSLDWEQPSVTLQLTDGSCISTNPRATTFYSPDGSGQTGYGISYEYLSEDSSRRFLSLSDIVSVQIEDATIRIEE